MIEITKLDASIKLDVRYATEDNFMGRVVYPAARVFLQPVAAEAVVRAHRKLGEDGLGLVLFDGYRPWSITKLFWEVTNDEQRKFVADPERGSKHNRGCAVDVSLFDLASGELLPMPSGYDEFTKRASPDYQGGTAEATANRERLRSAMEAEGFFVNPREWWHYDHREWESYEIYDLSFDEIADLSS